MVRMALTIRKPSGTDDTNLSSLMTVHKSSLGTN